MSNVIKFPIKREHNLSKQLEIAKEYYIKAGLSKESVDIAIIDLENHLKQFTYNYESSMDLSSSIGLTSEQISAITDVHNECMQRTFSHFMKQLGIANCIITGLVCNNYK